MTTFGTERRRAHGVLGFALLLLLASQFFPYAYYEERLGWYALGLKEEAQWGWAAVTDGYADPLAISEWLAALFYLVVLTTSPWLVGFLGRTLPLLWTLRILMIAMVGIMAWTVKSLADEQRLSEKAMMDLVKNLPTLGISGDMLFPLSAGFWLLLSAGVVNMLGLFLIPKAKGE
jgi:hypothetical protein